jgi:hypothetical protein
MMSCELQKRWMPPFPRLIEALYSVHGRIHP